ncbi:MAG: hypothetical protein AAFV98_13895 [Chloroflexota bacterium]
MPSRKEIEQKIKRIRAKLVEYDRKIKEVEEADELDFLYWQGLTDEERWLKEDLKKLLDALDSA